MERINLVTKEKDELIKEKQVLDYQKEELKKLNKILIKENESLKIELNQVKPFVERFTLSSHKLDMILKHQQVVCNKAGLGYRSYQN